MTAAFYAITVIAVWYVLYTVAAAAWTAFTRRRRRVQAERDRALLVERENALKEFTP